MYYFDNKKLAEELTYKLQIIFYLKKHQNETYKGHRCD